MCERWKLTKYKIVESLIDPNADVDKKYLSTAIATADGKTITGLLIEETKDHVTIFDGKEKREIKVANIDTQLEGARGHDYAVSLIAKGRFGIAPLFRA